MPNRRHPVVVAARLTERERALIGAAAELEGVTIHDLLRRIVLPAAALRVAASAQEIAAADGPSEGQV